MGKPIGEHFAAELEAAGLGGLPISWSADGTLDLGSLTPQQKAKVLQIHAAHDATRIPLPALKAEAGRIITAVVSGTAQLNLNAAMNVIGAKEVAARSPDEAEFVRVFAEGHAWIQAVRARVRELDANGGRTPAGEGRWPQPSQAVRDLAALY